MSFFNGSSTILTSTCTRNSEMSQSYNPQLTVAARSGDVISIRRLINEGADIDQKGDEDLTPLMEAAMAGKGEAVAVLLDNEANPRLRDAKSQDAIKLALDHGHKDIAEVLADRHPDMTVTDPRLPKGEAFLREQFRLIVNDTKDPASRPDPALWDRLLAGDYDEPVEERSASNVYWEHIFLCFSGNRVLDIERNYSKDLKQVRMGTFNEFFDGHKGILRSSRLLPSVLPTRNYVIAGTVVMQTNETSGWVTERWGYYDPENNVQVTDGIDTFLIESGKIILKMANYNVEKKVDDRSVFEWKVGLKGGRNSN